MGLFGKFKKKNIVDSNDTIQQCISCGIKVFNHLEMQNNVMHSEEERQIAASFIFGVINAFAIENKMTPPQVHAVTLKILISNFFYSAEQAASFAQILIDATKQGRSPPMFYIIHKGIDGYYQYKSDELEQLKSNYDEVLRKSTSS